MENQLLLVLGLFQNPMKGYFGVLGPRQPGFPGLWLAQGGALRAPEVARAPSAASRVGPAGARPAVALAWGFGRSG